MNTPTPIAVGGVVKVIGGGRFLGRTGKVVKVYDCGKAAIVRGQWGNPRFAGRTERAFAVEHLTADFTVDMDETRPGGGRPAYH
jgi:hypothetical protein